MIGTGITLKCYYFIVDVKIMKSLSIILPLLCMFLLTVSVSTQSIFHMFAGIYHRELSYPQHTNEISKCFVRQSRHMSGVPYDYLYRKTQCCRSMLLQQLDPKYYCVLHLAFLLASLWEILLVHVCWVSQWEHW